MIGGFKPDVFLRVIRSEAIGCGKVPLIPPRTCMVLVRNMISGQVRRVIKIPVAVFKPISQRQREVYYADLPGTDLRKKRVWVQL